ncbi:MAG: D-2-hydroxyacid dehydrogenase [Clostridia bacterium]|nr:D-2-hydroxyacid dehydrogenase [Clostridia bacterium]
MKIVVLDHPRENPGEIDWSQLERLGETRIYSRAPADKLIETIGDAEVVFLNKSPLTREVIEACPNIKYISVIATGYNTVDVKAAAERGILVSNVPSYGTGAIAQHAIALLMEITNHIAYNDAEVRKGRQGEQAGDWCFWDYPCIELENKTMGIIGLGRIGQYVARAAVAFGMKVIAFDKFESDEMKGIGVEYVDLDTLYANADVISLHCPLFEDTKGMINKDSIAKMKNGVILINNSRGALVDEQALADALVSGKVYAAGLDAMDPEPPSLDNPLFKAPNCFITPHISWAALECRQRLVRYAIDNFEAFLAGKPTNIVN